MRTLLAVAALAVALLAAPAAAHVTVTVDPLEAPLVVGQPTEITVNFSQACFEFLPPEGATSVSSGLTPDAPTTVLWVGENVPFTLNMCDPLSGVGGAVKATAKLTVTPSANAPGLVNVTLPVTSYLDGGAEHGEEVVDLNVTVAHYANGTLSASLHAAGNGTNATGNTNAGNAPNGTHHGAPKAGKTIELEFEYTTNAESLLTIEATSSVGEVREIDAVAVSPPSFTNKSVGVAEAEATFQPPANWTTADLTFTAYLTPIVGGARIEVATTSLRVVNDVANATVGEDGGDHHEGGDADDEGSNGIPSPAFGVVAVALLVFAARRRSA